MPDVDTCNCAHRLHTRDGKFENILSGGHVYCPAPSRCAPKTRSAVSDRRTSAITSPPEYERRQRA